MIRHPSCVASVFAAALLTAALLPTQAADPDQHEHRLVSMAKFPDRQPTGIAVASDGRLFVSFPRWSVEHAHSVVLLQNDGSSQPYPDLQWNTWSMASSVPPAERFVCVQSIWTDKSTDSLWVLDAASPFQAGTIAGGPKLVRINLKSNQVERVYPFDAQVTPPRSYLNDVRVDEKRGTAYLTESGLGALIVLDLATGSAHRVLDRHHSTTAEPNVDIVIDNKPLRAADGSRPQIHADGIALSADGEYLYYHALTGKTLYRVPTAILRSSKAAPEEIESAVETVATTVITDGLWLEGTRLYHTSLEKNAIVYYDLARQELSDLIIDKALAWPDTLAQGPSGDLYVSVSRIHEMPRFNAGQPPRREPYEIFRIRAQGPTADASRNAR